jgi:hypothetical protein
MNSDEADTNQPPKADAKPAAAFPQGQAAFPNNSSPGPDDTRGWSVKKIMDELSGTKPAY